MNMAEISVLPSTILPSFTSSCGEEKVNVFRTSANLFANSEDRSWRISVIKSCSRTFLKSCMRAALEEGSSSDSSLVSKFYSLDLRAFKRSSDMT